MKRIRVSHPAERDLDDLWYYIAKHSGSIQIADRWIESITETFALLARAPEAGAKRDEIAPGLRGFPVGNYIIYSVNIGAAPLPCPAPSGARCGQAPPA